MQIDLSKYKVVYNDRVLRALSLEMVTFASDYMSPAPNDKVKIVKPDWLTLLVINDDGNLVAFSDQAWKFQFIPDLKREAQGNGV